MSIPRLASPTLLVAALSACTSQGKDGAGVPPPSAIAAVDQAPAGVPDQRDVGVLESFLLALLDDAEFNLAGSTTDPEMIVLDERVPSKTGFLEIGQVQGELQGQHALPDELIEELLRRNQKPGTQDTFPASFSGLGFDQRIVVADLHDVCERSPRNFKALEDAYPQASAFVCAWLPAYAADGMHALVRASVSPTPHGATVTALLTMRGEVWVVVWKSVSYYA